MLRIRNSHERGKQGKLTGYEQFLQDKRKLSLESNTSVWVFFLKKILAVAGSTPTLISNQQIDLGVSYELIIHDCHMS